MERREEEVARAIAGEDPARSGCRRAPPAPARGSARAPTDRRTRAPAAPSTPGRRSARPSRARPARARPPVADTRGTRSTSRLDPAELARRSCEEREPSDREPRNVRSALVSARRPVPVSMNVRSDQPSDADGSSPRSPRRIARMTVAAAAGESHGSRPIASARSRPWTPISRIASSGTRRAGSWSAACAEHPSRIARTGHARRSDDSVSSSPRTSAAGEPYRSAASVEPAVIAGALGAWVVAPEVRDGIGSSRRRAPAPRDRSMTRSRSRTMCPTRTRTSHGGHRVGDERVLAALRRDGDRRGGTPASSVASSPSSAMSASLPLTIDRHPARSPSRRSPRCDSSPVRRAPR